VLEVKRPIRRKMVDVMSRRPRLNQVGHDLPDERAELETVAEKPLAPVTLRRLRMGAE
jgi:hypothetical protein